MRETLLQYGLKDVEVAQTHSEHQVGKTSSTIYVLTQERALSALEQPGAFGELGLFIVDEVQNVERVAGTDDERARTMRDVIGEVLATVNPETVVLSGPSVENIEELTRTFLGDNAVTVQERLPSVVNLTYSHAKRGKRLLLRQHSSLTRKPLEIDIEQSEAIPGNIFGGQRYSDSTFDFIRHVLQRLGDSTSIVFSPTSPQATATAIGLTEGMVLRKDDEKLDELVEYISMSVHPQYALAACVSKSVGYHHGKMPRHARIAIEDAFKEGCLSAIACTTTLMQGVNLPAKNLIIRNPHLFVRRSSNRPNARACLKTT